MVSNYSEIEQPIFHSSFAFVLFFFKPEAKRRKYDIEIRHHPNASADEKEEEEKKLCEGD